MLLGLDYHDFTTMGQFLILYETTFLFGVDTERFSLSSVWCQLLFVF